MNLAIRDIRHQKGRFLLTGIGLGLLLGVVMSMVGIYRGLLDDALALVRTGDLWVVEEGTRGPFADASQLAGATREMVAAVAGVAAVGAVTYRSAEAVRMNGGGHERVYVIGYELGRPGGPPTIVAGRGIARSHFEIVADRRARLAIDERIRIGRDTFTVVGLTANQVASGGDPVVFMTLADSQVLQFTPGPASARRDAARRAGAASAPAPAPAPATAPDTGTDTDTVNALLVVAAPGMPVERLADDIGRWKHLAALTRAHQEDFLIQSVVEKARKQIGLFTVILVVVSAVIIALIIHTLTLDKRRDIATLKLIGAPDRTIVGLIVQQALALGAVGFISGASLVTLVKDDFPRRVILLPEDLLAMGLVVVFVCVAASGLGVRLALKIDPATALGG